MSPREGDVYLGPYAAIECSVKTHNAFDATATRGDVHAAHPHFSTTFGDPVAREQFITSVMDRLAATLQARDLRGVEDREEATVRAVREGAGVIVAPEFPKVNHRWGSPRILIRGADRENGSAGYYPLQIRAKFVCEGNIKSTHLRVSALGRPFYEKASTLVGGRIRPACDNDLIHLAHFWTMLSDLGWSCPGPAMAGLIGRDRGIVRISESGGRAVVRTSRSAGRGEFFIAWTNLDEKNIRTFQRRTDLYKLRSPLERYDHEFRFRLRVAGVASQLTGDPDDPPPSVTPIVVPECELCPWWSTCATRLAPNDISLRISKARFDTREIRVLRSLGVEDIDDLVRADIDDLASRYVPEVSHRSGAERRLRVAAHRAQMIEENRWVERTNDGPLGIPEPSFEIDWDIETSAAGMVYLWGFFVRDAREANDPGRYVSFSRFARMNGQAEKSLALEAISWMVKQIEEHPDVRFYHYSPYELNHLRRVTKRSEEANVDARRIAEHAFDLFEVVSRHYFGAGGLGLKVLATKVAGFSWRDEDPGGLNSQLWFEDATGAESEADRAGARTRILEYNEDDVRATAALRAWLRRQ